MTAQGRKTDHALLRPIVFFPTLFLLVVISVLVTPRTITDQGDFLSTHSTAANGAAGVADVVEKFGWSVRRLEEPFSDDMPADAVYAVLVPPYELTPSETHILLDRVRAGASAVVLLGGG